MIWLYALTDNPSARLPATGEHGVRELRQTQAGEIAGVWSTWSQTDAKASTEDGLWRQEVVLEALMRDRTVLPLRYGTVLQNSDGVRDMIINRREEWLDALRHVRGSVEMAVRASVQAPPAGVKPDGESGTDYLKRRGQERAGERALTKVIHGRLAAISIASDVQVNAVAAPQLTASYLVPRPDVDGFKLAVRRLAEEDPELAISCTGPWPPYSFVQPGGRSRDRRAAA